MKLRWAILIGLMFLNQSAADAVTFESGPEQTSLVELFTSEGCSSCPPADKRMSSFLTSPSLWKSFVPVAFHVDYWNGLGWEDRFAKDEFTNRQKTYARLWGKSSIYTPSFVVNGIETKNWPGIQELNQKRANIAGMLRVEIRKNEVVIQYRWDAGQKKLLQAQIAILGLGLESKVRSGENSGQVLHHDFVVLSLETAALSQVSGSDETEWMGHAPFKSEFTQPKRKAVAVWVYVEGDQVPIQSVGGFIN